MSDDALEVTVTRHGATVLVVVAVLLERLGLGTGAVSNGAASRMFSTRTPFSADEERRLDAMLDRVYADFVGKVAEGRSMSADAVDAVARGRVWSGTDAARNGLVDQLGGLRDAVAVARSRAGLPDDAPVRAALRVPPLARLGRARNSEDPRAVAASLGVGPLDDLLAGVGLSSRAVLLMPDVRLR